MVRLTKKLGGAIAGGAMGILLLIVPWFEGTEMQSYQDAVGVWTVCTGHTGDVTAGMTATPAQCEAFLRSDLGVALSAVDDLVTVDIPETTRASLGSFVFNVGRGAFAGSTLLKKLNAGDIVGACNQLPRWVYAGGKRLRGLVTRRAEERSLCLMGVE
ncbi:lysozyme [Salinicola sp. V024]|uniref:lysozyme n=1 Tax=Salinicola sp. V024 TaxID=3459609 RepID=UPI0040446F79